MVRIHDLSRFYDILDILENKLGGKQTLSTCNGRMNWPLRGVYFFFEGGENRCQSGSGPRVVRVGTHALTSTSRSTLWQRLSQHQGSLKSGEGNHRGSIFRLHVGTALLKRDPWPEEIRRTWGKGSNAAKEVRQAEGPLEQAVSRHIRQMPFLWLKVDDEPGTGSLRGVIERNAIALLSNINEKTTPLDPQSPSWLGHFADRDSIRFSGLWNVNHVAETYEPAFMDIFKELVNRHNYGQSHK